MIRITIPLLGQIATTDVATGNFLIVFDFVLVQTYLQGLKLLNLLVLHPNNAEYYKDAVG